MARWDGVYEFIQVVEHNSFTEAGKALNMSTPQVSKLVARLEKRLGARLLQRTTRTISLTDEGQQFYRRSKAAIESMEQAEQDIVSARNEPRGGLRINITGVFSEAFWVPVLARFSQKFPKLDFSLDFNDKLPELNRDEYDVSLSHSRLRSPNYVARKLMDSYHYLVASPGYLETFGRPLDIDQLKQHNCLSGADTSWFLSDGEQTIQIRPEGNWLCENNAAMLSAARSGVGIVSLPFNLVLEDIAQGKLEQVLPEWSRHPHSIWISYPQKRNLPMKIKLLVEHLNEELNKVRL